MTNLNTLPHVLLTHVSTYLTPNYFFRFAECDKRLKQICDLFYREVLRGDNILNLGCLPSYSGLCKEMIDLEDERIMIGKVKILLKKFPVYYLKYSTSLLQTVCRLENPMNIHREASFLLAKMKVDYPRVSIQNQEAYELLCKARQDPRFKKEAGYLQALMNIEIRSNKLSLEKIIKRLEDYPIPESVSLVDNINSMKKEQKKRVDLLYEVLYRCISKKEKKPQKYVLFDTYFEANLLYEEISHKVSENIKFIPKIIEMLEISATNPDSFCKMRSRLLQYRMNIMMIVNRQFQSPAQSIHYDIPSAILYDLTKETEEENYDESFKNYLNSFRPGILIRWHNKF